MPSAVVKWLGEQPAIHCLCCNLFEVSILACQEETVSLLGFCRAEHRNISILTEEAQLQCMLGR